MVMQEIKRLEKNESENKMNDSMLLVKASIRKLRVSPQKLNLVASMIRNMNVANAIVQLTFSPKRVAFDVKKCLQSAVANAENNFGLDIDNLIIKSITVGKALTMKRMRARARGRSAKIIKPFSNLYITVSYGGEN
jgi:large subunit ribosomal protein L22